MHIRKGDLVEVITGNYKGARGEVQRVIPEKNRVVVKGVNMVKKHQRQQTAGGTKAQGGIIEFEAPINASNVMIVCPDTDKPTRVGFRYDDEGNKVRYSKRSGVEL